MLTKKLLGLFAAFFVSGAMAFAPSPSTTSGNVTTFGASTLSKTGGMTFRTGANGDIFASYPGQQRMPVPGGGTIPLDITGKASKANAAAAFGRFAKKVSPLATAFAAADLARELGFMFSQEGNLQKGPDPLNCYTAPCYEWRAGVGQSYGQWARSKGDAFSSALSTENLRISTLYACPATAGKTAGASVLEAIDYNAGTYRAANRSCNCTYPPGATACVFALGAPTYSSSTAGTFSSRAKDPDPAPEPQAATVDELVDAIMAKEGWPDTSKWPEAVKTAIEAGESVPVTVETVTGPATSPNSKTTQNNVTNNTTTTTTSTNNHTYNGNKVTTVVNTTAITVNNSTGQIVNNTTTAQEPPAEEQTPFEMPCGIAGKAPCNVKVDEEGVKQSGDYSKADTALTTGTKAVTDAMGDATKVQDLGGNQWSFVFPSGTCAPIPISWALGSFTIDLCSFPMIDLFRAFWAWAFGVMGALYIWRSATSAIG